MKRIFWIVNFLHLFIAYNICLAQEHAITSYKNYDHENINITLNGKVKVLKQISNLPNKFCDTIPYNIDTSHSRIIHSREISQIKCIRDTIICFFDNNSFPEKIKDIHCYIDASNRKFCNKTIYRFVNRNLISETNIENAEISDNTIYKYDLKNNIILKRRSYYGVLKEDSLEYDYNNNLIKKVSYRYELGKKNKPVLYATEIYQYDSIGHLLANTMDNNRKNIYIYDVHGNKIEEGCCENFKGKKCKYKPLKGFVYDENNRLIKRFSIGDWKPHNTDTYYQYDDQGNEIEAKGYYINKDTVLGYHYVYQYNKTGQQIKEEVKVGDYSSIDFVKYRTHITSFDNYDNIIQQGYYMVDNQVVKLIRYAYSYDSYGNWTKKEKFEGKNEQDLSIVAIDERVIEYY